MIGVCASLESRVDIASIRHWTNFSVDVCASIDTCLELAVFVIDQSQINEFSAFDAFINFQCKIPIILNKIGKGEPNRAVDPYLPSAIVYRCESIPLTTNHIPSDQYYLFSCRCVYHHLTDSPADMCIFKKLKDAMEATLVRTIYSRYVRLTLSHAI